MTLQEGPLAWPYLPLCDLAADPLGLTSAQQDTVIALAVEWMWSRSARRFGTRPVLFRPPTVQPMRTVNLFYGAPLGGVYGSGYPGYGYSGGCNGDDWARQRVLELPGPVVSVQQVIINGAVLDPEGYRLDGKYLVRHDGAAWPQTQNMIAAPGNTDTWSIAYTRGEPVSTFGQYATGRLICYFAKKFQAGEACELPYNTTGVTRGGVSIRRDTSKAAQTSPVPEVDQWLSMVNPNGLQAPPVVWSPDGPRARWPYGGSLAGQTQNDPPQGQPSAFNVLVLNPDEQVPPGTPAGTVILWTDGTAVPASVAPHLVVPLGEQAPAGVPPGTVLLQTET